MTDWWESDLHCDFGVGDLIQLFLIHFLAFDTGESLAFLVLPVLQSGVRVGESMDMRLQGRLQSDQGTRD